MSTSTSTSTSTGKPASRTAGRTAVGAFFDIAGEDGDEFDIADAAEFTSGEDLDAASFDDSFSDDPAYGGAFEDIIGGDYDDGYRDGKAGADLPDNRSDDYNRGWWDGNKDLGSVLGAGTSVDAAADAMREVLRRVRDERAPETPYDVVPDDEYDATTDLDHGACGNVFYDGDTPIAAMLSAHFDVGPVPIRVDTEETYSDFRADGSEAMRALEKRVDDLDALLKAHIADKKVHVAGVLSDISALLPAAEGAPPKVPLALPPDLAEKDWGECWREDDMVCCSIRVPGDDGEVRILTTAVPLSDGVEEVTGCAARAGVHPVDVLGALPTTAVMLCGTKAMKRLCAAAPAALDRPEVAGCDAFVGVATKPDGAVLVATLAALLQECQGGNQAACDEWKRIADKAASDSDLADAMSAAKRGVAAARKIAA